MRSNIAVLVAIPIVLAANFVPSRQAYSQGVAMAPSYSRMRTGADTWNSRGGGHDWGHGHGGYGYGYNYYQPYYSSVIAGSWYARPYPYHFDYYRYRWGNQPANGAEIQPPQSDCPCANVAAPMLTEPVEAPAIPPAPSAASSAAPTGAVSQ